MTQELENTSREETKHQDQITVADQSAVKSRLRRASISARKKPVVSSLLAFTTLLVGLSSTIASLRAAPDQVRWSKDAIISIGSSCSGMYDWLDSNVSWNKDGDVTVNEGAEIAGQGYIPKYCVDRDHVSPGETVTLTWTVVNIGTEPLKNMWLTAYWDSKGPEAPEYLNYLPGQAALFIDGNQQELTYGWEANGQKIKSLRPGEIINLTYTMRIDRSAPVGSSQTFPIKFYAEGFGWRECDQHVTII